MYNKNLEYLLSYEVDKVISQKSVFVRRKINPLLRSILKVLNPYKLHIIRQTELPKNRPLIFTPNHGFKDDFLNALIIANTHCYTLFGSLDQFYNTLGGQLANLFGVVMVNRDDPKSRETAIPKMIKAIEYGANALIFPEGCWNLTDAELAMKLYNGFHKIAEATGALIVPIGVHFEGKSCYAIRDEPFEIKGLPPSEAKIILRDKLATLQYELIEKFSVFSRKEFEVGGLSLKEQWINEVIRRKKEVKYYIEEKEITYPYKDSTITEFTEVFAHLDTIKLTKENAFLLRPTRSER